MDLPPSSPPQAFSDDDIPLLGLPDTFLLSPQFSGTTLGLNTSTLFSTSPLSSPTTPHAANLAHAPSDFSELSVDGYIDGHKIIDGVVVSSPVLGTRKERGDHRRRKGMKPYLATLTEQKAERDALAAAKKKKDLNEVLALLKHKDLKFHDLMTHVFDPDEGQGTTRWQEFFVMPGRVTQVLN
ncbi:hypothetical protein DXG01_008588 [Tephrocybe rancida]|nr:hypothetical protein DXG01_008588 [Tephrocybe rancida]